MSQGVVLLLVTVSTTLSPLLSLASTPQDPFRLERETAAYKWSPLVWLHPAEDYFPSSVPFFLRHVFPSTETNKGQGQAVVQQDLTASQLHLPSGRPSQDFYLMVLHSFGCQDCTLPGFLHGQKPQKKHSPPVYATIHTCTPLPSARPVRSTQNSHDDELINFDIYADAAEDTTAASLSSTDHRSIFPITNVTMLPKMPFLYLNHTYSLSNISSQLNQTQPYQIHSLVSTPGFANPQNISYEENAITVTPSICMNNGSLYPTSNNEEKTNNSLKNIQTTKDARNLHTTSMGVIDNLQLNTTETPNTNEPHTTESYVAEFSNSSQITSQPYNAHVNDTDDLGNSSKLMREQYHNNERRHARPYEQQYTVTYWMFYPYNRGKKVCTVNLGILFGRMFKPKVNDVCHGEEITMGNHVGDWEHVSIQFRGSRPVRMYVSAHTFGAYYTYDPNNHRFIYEDKDTREGIALSPVYPKTIQFTESHPILYSARGSHGLWGAEGINQYNSLPILQDETGKGTPWKIWKNLELIDVHDPLSMQPHGWWWKYEGRWGNPSSKCHLLMAGTCEHSNGPTGIPRKRVNFPC